MTTWRLCTSTLAGALFSLTVSTTAFAQEACSFYTLRNGDTLNKIASTARSPGGYQLLYSANAATIRDAGGIGPGVEIRIPCANGSLPTKAAKPAATSSSASTTATSRPLRFLTASDYAPFTDEAAREGGLFTELVRRAMEAGAPDTAYDVVFVNDWGAHLTDLLPYAAFDLGFPWFLPDCSRLDRLSPPNRLRCTEYDASDPFFEAVVGYYAAVDSAYQDARTPQDLFGARVCRPDGWFTFDLEAFGLTAPNVALIVPPTQHDCWRLLQAGEVDVVTFEALAAEEDLAALSLKREVREVAALATVETLHVFSHKTRANGPADLAALNAGLKSLRTSGQWYEIVADQMREHLQRIATAK